MHAPAEPRDDGVPRQTPAGKQRRNTVGDLVLVLPVDFRQLFLGHIEVTSIKFGNLLELHNGLAEASFANQPARRFDDISAGSQKNENGVQNGVDGGEFNLPNAALRDLLGEN